jgi:hypothetical protein
MKSSDIFDTCFARYRTLREWLKDAEGSARAFDLEAPSDGYIWRPDRARACEYVADFERIARQALARPEWKGRRKLFNVYFVRGADYRRALGLVGVSESTFDYWYREVKRVAGAAFSRAGLFPPGRYFRVRGVEVIEAGRPASARTPRPRADQKIAQQGNAKREGKVEEILEQV